MDFFFELSMDEENEIAETVKLYREHERNGEHAKRDECAHRVCEIIGDALEIE